MGLREKVALIVAIVSLLQLTTVYCSPKEDKPKRGYSNKQKERRNIDNVIYPPTVKTVQPHIQATSRKTPEKTNEAIFKTFNFPDVEYPTASTPRTPFYLQETNILQRNPGQPATEYPSSNAVQFPMNNGRKDVKMKYKNKATHGSLKAPGSSVTFSDLGTTPKPYSLKEEVAFPDVEYPLSAKEIWKPNYWKEIPSGLPKTEMNKNWSVGSPASTGESGKKYLNNLNIGKSKPITQNTIAKNGKPYDQDITPAPILSQSTMSTTPSVVTPYTTLYFDATPTYIDSKSTIKDENKDGDVDPKNLKRRKKTKKHNRKMESSSTGITKTLEEDNTSSTSKTRNGDDLSLIYDTTITLSKETTKTHNGFLNLMPDKRTPNEDFSVSGTCSAISNDTLMSMYVVTTTPSYLNYDINSTPIHDSDDNIPTSLYDKKVTSISDAINKIVVKNRHNKDSSCFEDSVINNNVSSVFEDNVNISRLCSRENVNPVPSIDEEFTTDVFPDFDESIMPIFTVSTSTLSPLTFDTDDDAWANSIVIDPYKSKTYPDELEEYYIAVP